MKHLIHPTRDQACTPSGLEHVQINDPEQSLHIAMRLIQDDTRSELCKLAHDLRTILVLNTGSLPWPEQLSACFSPIFNRDTRPCIENTIGQPTIIFEAASLQKKLQTVMLSHPNSTVSASLRRLPDQLVDPLFRSNITPFDFTFITFGLPDTIAITGDKRTLDLDESIKKQHHASLITELREMVMHIPRIEQNWDRDRGTIVVAPENTMMHQRKGLIMNGQILPHCDTRGGTIIFGKSVHTLHPQRIMVHKTF